MRLLIITNERFPTNRPMLSELWNKEFTQRGHSIIWIMLPSETNIFVRKTMWGMNTVYLLPSFGKNILHKILSRFIGFVWLIFLIPCITIAKKIDIVHIHNALGAGVLTSLLHIKFLFAYTFPFHLLAKSVRHRFPVAILRAEYNTRLLSFVLRNAASVFPISIHLQHVLEDQYGLSAERSFPVSESASSLFLEYKLPRSIQRKRQRFIYVGEMSRMRHLELVFDAFEYVKKKYNNAEIQFIGWGLKTDDIPWLERYVSGFRYADAVIFSQPVSYEKIPELVAPCLAGLSPIPPIELYLNSTPTKCVEYLSLGVPVIANKEIHDQKYIVEQSGGGILVDYSVSAIADAMCALLSNPSKAEQLGAQGKVWVASNRTYSAIASKIEERILKV